MANKVYEIVTQRIIQKIEEAIKNDDVLPWQKPWRYSLNAPQNYVSGKKYKGVNCLLLDPGEYITYTQICELKNITQALSLRKAVKRNGSVF